MQALSAAIKQPKKLMNVKNVIFMAEFAPNNYFSQYSPFVLPLGKCNEPENAQSSFNHFFLLRHI